MSDGLGFSLEATRRTLTKLFEQKERILKTIDDAGYAKRQLKGMRPRAEIMEHATLVAQLEEVEHDIAETRDYYSLHLLESLDSASKELNRETKKLSGLTCWLTGLTSVLAILTLVLVIRTLL